MSTEIKNIENQLFKMFPTMMREDNVFELEVLNYTIRLTSEKLGNNVVVFKDEVNCLVSNDYDTTNRVFALAAYFAQIESIKRNLLGIIEKGIEKGEIKYVRVHNDGACAYQMVNIDGKRFKLHADTSKSSCCGFDRDMCAKLLLPSGEIKNLFDARSVGGYPNGSYCRDKKMAREHVERCFSAMRDHLVELYL